MENVQFDIQNLPRNYRIWLFTGYTDLRKSVDGLSDLAQYDFGIDTSSSIMMFCGRRADRIKVLYRTNGNYGLLYYRYENDSLSWPRADGEAWELSYDQMEDLLNGRPLNRKIISNIITSDR